MKYDSQYYMLKESGRAASYMLDQVEGSDEGLGRLMAIHPIHRRVLGPGRVGISEGNRAKFQPCDYHETAEQLVSEKFRKVLAPFNLPGIDFYQTDIVNDDKTWSDYYFMHIWNHHKAIHKKRSEIKGTYVGNRFTLLKLSLHEKVLDQVPLEERLVFTLEEKPVFLFHESVVAALRAADLSGLGFRRVDSWSIGSAFEDDDDDFYDDL
ncbi:imm11 family protein [Photobacterium sp. Hal280]|uniref:imm11 family protein n=1 Tax=Photobacterium sp. Hal280 TaxID=3035163 RepID=UPI00301DE57D